MEKKKRICLFTAHSPTSGGGGAILRSLVANLPGVDVAWYYTNNKPVAGYEDGYLGQNIMGGPFLKDIIQTYKMLKGGQVPAIDGLLQKLLSVDCDAYWIVTHNEGLRLAFDLARTQQGRPVHMTIHDDWAGALSARSVRYRLMAGAARRLTVKVLQAVTSFDVVSDGMQQYYQKLSGRKGAICHRYLPAASINVNAEISDNPGNKVLIGHIGSIYRKEDLLAFINLVKDFYAADSKKPLLQMWGCHLTMADVPEGLKPYIVFHPTLSEEKVIPELSKCSFVYAMYPMEQSLRIFAETSLPTKLTSYLQSGRPVFGHCPAGSTLAGYLNNTGLGVQWNTADKAAGFAALTQFINLAVSPEQLFAAREKYFGENNLAVMTEAFGIKHQQQHEEK
jgi:hypothetical protein